VEIGSSPPLAYCFIFIVITSEVVDLHICICIYSYQSLFVPVYEQAACAAAQFSGSVGLFSPVCYRMMRSHVTAAVFKLGARFLDTFQVRHC